MAECSKTFNILRLNNENYATWSFEVEMLLRRDDLWQYVEAKAASTDAKWISADGKALATIALACERTQYTLIQPCKTSGEAWRVLKERHEKMSVCTYISNDSEAVLYHDFGNRRRSGEISP